MKKLTAWILALFCIFVLAACGMAVQTGSGTSRPDTVGKVTGGIDDTLFPKRIHPIIQVGGRHYYWTGMAESYKSENGVMYIENERNVFLDIPEGYTAAGVISDVTEDPPAKELELKAGVEATGTIFTNPETPEVVYVRMTTADGWLENDYVRFVSDDLHDNGCLSYQGRQYCINLTGSENVCEIAEELPAECVLIGNLKFIGCDRIPTGDLETNRLTDSHGSRVDGREVYGNPDDLSKLYVYEQRHRRDGDYPAWRICELRDE
ncbi:MAG: hypothetical protein IJD13_03205 [Oscillospiraceae bacterium]|nr:hypothetical protein [Oscillospiraceae bacterium]